MRQQRPYPRITVTRKAARSLASGSAWVFEGEVLGEEPGPDGRLAENGGVVDVFEQNGTWQGAGLISRESKIRVRLVTRNANDRIDESFWRRKLAWAWQYRVTCMGTRALPGCPPDTDCCRVLFSEADGFPGLIVDRYGDVLVSQVGTVGMEMLRPTIYPLLLEVLRDAGQDVAAIYERCDIASREREGLPLRKGWWDGADAACQALSPRRTICENGILFELDLEESQKTGFFLDQKYNRRAVRDLSLGRRVLDCFCHVGPFALNAAAGGAKAVRGVDASQVACDLAAANTRLNGMESVSFTCANVMEYLPALKRDASLLRSEGGPFDLIVLDPPAFTKSRSTANSAARGYRQVNYDALRLLPRGGYLATCSCSHFMPASRLSAVVAEAAHDAGVQLRQIEERQQAPDHPILVGMPETSYLKFFLYQVV